MKRNFIEDSPLFRAMMRGEAAMRCDEGLARLSVFRRAVD
jgi:hypothetical protein